MLMLFCSTMYSYFPLYPPKVNTFPFSAFQLHSFVIQKVLRPSQNNRREVLRPLVLDRE